MQEKTKSFETERLILRKFEKNDAEHIYNNYASKDNVTEFLSWKSHKTIEDTRSYLENFVLPAYENEDTYRWAIELKETNQVIGCIDVVRMNKNFKKVELGWVLDDTHWGKGLMPEAARVILDYMVEEGFVRIEAHHNVANPKSGRVMEKIGMQFEGVLRKSAMNNDGELVDMKMYAYVVE